LIETHKFANGESDVYSIDRANFDIILRLVKKAPEFFKDLDIENIREDDYKRILVLFEPDTSMIEN